MARTRILVNDSAVTPWQVDELGVTVPAQDTLDITSTYTDADILQAVNNEGLTFSVSNYIRVDTPSGTADIQDASEFFTVLKPYFDDHAGSTANPHSVSKTQVELGNVDNTSDADKPVSTAQQSALDGKVNNTGDETVAGDKTFSGIIKSLPATPSDDNIDLTKSTSTTGWTINAGRTAFYDQWLLFKNSGEAGAYTFAISNNGAFRGKNGSGGAPTYTFDNASNYGMSYDGGANEGLVLSTEGHARLRIEDDGTLSVAGTSNYEDLVTHDDDIPNKKYVDDAAGGVFGSEHSQVSGNSNWSSTSSHTPVQILRLTTGVIPAGTYRIGWSYEWAGSSSSYDFRARVQVDDTDTIMEQSQEPKDPGTDQAHPASGFAYVTFGSSGSHTIDLDYWDESNESCTSYIRRERLEIWRVS